MIDTVREMKPLSFEMLPYQFSLFASSHVVVAVTGSAEKASFVIPAIMDCYENGFTAACRVKTVGLIGGESGIRTRVEM
jgi:hypothetical protein